MLVTSTVCYRRRAALAASASAIKGKVSAFGILAGLSALFGGLQRSAQYHAVDATAAFPARSHRDRCRLGAGGRDTGPVLLVLPLAVHYTVAVIFTGGDMKGIILAGGSGTRLYPITRGVSKQLIPVYDKPMVYYPLSVLMLAGIREVLIITTPEDQSSFQRLLGDGTELGMRFEYVVQPSPDGLAQAFILGREFIGDDDVCLILGDNIYHGHDLSSLLGSAVSNARDNRQATVFGYHVQDPQRYGVVEFDAQGRVVGIEEKPEKPKSSYAVTGLYFYPNDVVQKAVEVKPSARGELEITTINQMFLAEGRLMLEKMGRGYAWLDTGTHESLLEASAFIETIEKRQGLKVACLEEIAFEMGYISRTQVLELARPLEKNQYGQYLIHRMKEEH
jgi:glucose-1-phosphate thymidylyltransferase